MKIKFFSQHFLMYVYEIQTVRGMRNEYLVLVYDTLKKWEEIVMVGSIKTEKYNLLTHTEVFLES
jgi:hypothetical protein